MRIPSTNPEFRIQGVPFVRLRTGMCVYEKQNRFPSRDFFGAQGTILSVAWAESFKSRNKTKTAIRYPNPPHPLVSKLIRVFCTHGVRQGVATTHEGLDRSNFGHRHRSSH